MDQGKIPSEIKALLTGDDQKIPQSGSSMKTSKNSKNNSSNGQAWVKSWVPVEEFHSKLRKKICCHKELLYVLIFYFLPDIQLNVCI